jgi:hypothetical protein
MDVQKVASEDGAVARSRRCVFCAAPASRKGEHVWTRWLMRLLRLQWHSDGGITVEKDGLPILDRHGVARKVNHVPTVLLPVCDHLTGDDCNGKLERLYEATGRKVVTAVILKGRPLTSRDEVETFARWWLKTLLLLHHPEAHDQFEGVMRRPWRLPPSTYPDLIEGRFPRDLSVWIAVCDDKTGTEHLDSIMRNYLVSTSRPDGAGGDPEAGVVGLRMASGPIAEFQVAFHPLCQVENPFEEQGLAIRLWPNPPSSLDVSAMPVLNATGRAQFGSLFLDSNSGAHLPEAGWRLHLNAVPEGDPLQLPTFIDPTGQSLLPEGIDAAW